MKILIAEDDPVAQHMLEVILEKWEYDVRTAHDGEEAWQMLQGEDAPRIAILDWSMPKMEGIQVCRNIRAQKAEPYTYVILLTAKDHKDDVVTGIEAGADDYLSKPFDGAELRARLRAGVRILALQESLVAAREALRFRADHDSLTGLWNRSATMDAFHRELSRATRQHMPVGLILADLDHFKQVNDTYGHLVGDEVLREAARRMAACGRLYDWVGRYGGEEFLMILPGCSDLDSVHQAERLRAEFSSRPFETSSGPITVTLSVGVAAGCNSTLQKGDYWIHAADQALYKAKEKGRNRVEFADPSPGGALAA